MIKSFLNWLILGLNFEKLNTDETDSLKRKRGFKQIYFRLKFHKDSQRIHRDSRIFWNLEFIFWNLIETRMKRIR
ncbi:hypothetical protein B0A72_10700 [Flavobacterium pectinovorum]|uniref:Transposase n=1 Tax=Flavobacterium pectinovorum TaxID=29533 RepID=A0AB36P1J0_9FLAO|nr:hypothetical protein B0A72_10700 [Flavobacterium pectinovorum]